MVGTSQMATTAVVLITLAIGWIPTGIVMAAPVEAVDKQSLVESEVRHLESLGTSEEQAEKPTRLEESLAKMKESLARMEEKLRRMEEKMESIEEKTEEKLVRMEVKVKEELGRREERMTQLVASLKVDEVLPKVELEGRYPTTSNFPPSALPLVESASPSPGTATTLIPSMTSEMQKPLPREDAVLRKLEGSPSTTSDPVPSALPAVEAASTSPSTATTSIPTMTSEMENLLPREDASSFEGTSPTISKPLPSAIPLVASASTFSFAATSPTMTVTSKKRRALGRALYKAAEGGRARDVDRLLKDGADVHYRNEHSYMRTPLHAAAMEGHVDVMALLIAAGADMNSGDDTEWTPMHLAVFWEKDAAVKMLIAAGAEVNIQSSSSQTPLHFAAETGRTEVVKALIVAKASKYIRDYDGKTPYDYARSSVRHLFQS